MTLVCPRGFSRSPPRTRRCVASNEYKAARRNFAERAMNDASARLGGEMLEAGRHFMRGQGSAAAGNVNVAARPRAALSSEMSACSACAGDYEEPDRTAWPTEEEKAESRGAETITTARVPQRTSLRRDMMRSLARSKPSCNYANPAGAPSKPGEAHRLGGGVCRIRTRGRGCWWRDDRNGRSARRATRAATARDGDR